MYFTLLQAVIRTDIQHLIALSSLSSINQVEETPKLKDKLSCISEVQSDLAQHPAVGSWPGLSSCFCGLCERTGLPAITVHEINQQFTWRAGFDKLRWNVHIKRTFPLPGYSFLLRMPPLKYSFKSKKAQKPNIFFSCF